MSQLDDTYNHAQGWYPRMPPPASFPREKVKAYQKRIDGIVGTRDERPIIKLAWAPDELRWKPHVLPNEPPGYVFPIFCFRERIGGELVSVPRWVLLQRAEPQHYAATWEAGRYGVYNGQVWDMRGPCPSERYTELRVHAYHDGECCPCHGDSCDCGEQYDHCWGKYLDPNERLLDWIRETNYHALADKDVDPNRDVREHAAPNAQRDWVNAHQKAEEKRVIAGDELSREMSEFWARKPVSMNLKRTKSGIILLN